MKKTWLMIITGLTLLFTLGVAALAAGDGAPALISGIGSVTVATGTVTFQVDMSVRICEGGMTVGDQVSVPGSFNNWTPGATAATDPDGDSIYTVTVDIEEGDIAYKFHDGNDWESTPDRMYTVVPGAQTIPVVFFNDDSECNPPGGDVPVTFQVNMSVKIVEGSFTPGTGESMSVRGSFNGWALADTLYDLDGDSIYSKTIDLAEGSAIEYKFVIRNDDGSDTWEDNIGPNRMYTVPTGGGTIPVVWFDNDSVISIPVTQNILMVSDLEAYATMGWFNPALGDSVQVRGAFNNWAGTDFADDPLGNLEYEWLEQNFNGFSGDNFPYKFYIDFDEATAPSRFPGWADNMDGFNYEHPAERGDGNRIFVLPPVNGNVGPDVYWYSDINPAGILFSPDMVAVTLQVDMTPAVSQGFDASTDTVKLVWEDALWRSIQVAAQGGFPQIWDMTRQGATNIYNVTFDVMGTTHYNMQYHYRFVHPDGSSLTEGGGLGVQCPFRSRFIAPLGPNSFPTEWTAPLDSWDTDGAPLFCQSAPFNPLNGVELEDELGRPVAYRLLQNYPNPFNPVTRIKYAIPERSDVTLKVFNILGQEIATLVNGVQEQGNYVASFEANSLPTGVYFYRLDAGKFSQTKKMLLVK